MRKRYINNFSVSECELLKIYSVSVIEPMEFVEAFILRNQFNAVMFTFPITFASKCFSDDVVFLK